MHSPHLTSTALRDQKKMRPEDSYMAAYSMPTEQHPHHPVPPPQQQQQQQQHHHPQTAIDYKSVPHKYFLWLEYLQLFLSTPFYNICAYEILPDSTQVTWMLTQRQQAEARQQQERVNMHYAKMRNHMQQAMWEGTSLQTEPELCVLSP